MARSKAYPTFSLRECVEAAETLWGSLERKQATLEEVARALGYKGLSGPSRSKISALKQFGLLENAGRGTLRLSQRALDLLISSEGDSGRAVAAEEALKSVGIFSTMLSSHRDASEGAIEAYLLKQHNFSRVGAKNASRSFLDSLRYLEELSGSALPTQDSGSAQSTSEAETQTAGTVELGVPDSPGGVKKDIFSLTGAGQVIVQWPAILSQEDYDDIASWWPIVLRKIARCVQQAGASEEPRQIRDDLADVADA